MVTNELIESLARDIRPVHVIPAPERRAVEWWSVSMACLLVAVLVSGLRHDLTSRLNEPLFLIETFCLVVGATLFSLNTLKLAIPGLSSPRSAWILPSVLIGVWVACLVAQCYFSYSGSVNESIRSGFCCFRNLFLISLIPSTCLFLMVRRSAPLNPGLTGLMTGFSSTMFAAVGLQLICHHNDPVHTLVSHFLPVFILSILGAFLGPKFLRWYRS